MEIGKDYAKNQVLNFKKTRSGAHHEHLSIWQQQGGSLPSTP